MKIKYELIKKDENARLGQLHTNHGTFETPMFMPVGTLANKCRDNTIKHISLVAKTWRRYYKKSRRTTQIYELRWPNTYR